MKAAAARVLVRLVSRCIDKAYTANCEKHWRTEAAWAFVGRSVQRVVFPVAQYLNAEAMVDQMIEECWWG